MAQIHGVESWRGRPCLVVEFLAGGTLEDRLRDGPLDTRTKARAAQVKEAATEAATANREAAEAWDALATHARQASRRVSPRRGAGRPHPSAMGALSVIHTRASGRRGRRGSDRAGTRRARSDRCGHGEGSHAVDVCDHAW